MARRHDGSHPTRQQVMKEARKLTENNGIQLMHDGISFKIRVPTGKEEEGWRQIQAKPPPPGINYVAEGLTGSIPDRVIEKVMMETLNWEVKVVRFMMRGKGKDSTKKAFIKSAARPVTDTIQVAGKMVVMRELIEKTKTSAQQHEDFFAGRKEEEAARTVLKEKDPTQSMKDFAFKALKQEKTQFGTNSRKNTLQEQRKSLDGTSFRRKMLK